MRDLRHAVSGSSTHPAFERWQLQSDWPGAVQRYPQQRQARQRDVVHAQWGWVETVAVVAKMSEGAAKLINRRTVYERTDSIYLLKARNFHDSGAKMTFPRYLPKELGGVMEIDSQTGTEFALVRHLGSRSHTRWYGRPVGRWGIPYARGSARIASRGTASVNGWRLSRRSGS